MQSYKLSFSAVVSAEFTDCTIATDGDLTVVLKNGMRVFGIPTKNLIAFDMIPDVPAPVPAG
jgi:hypothetical protein